MGREKIKRGAFVDLALGPGAPAVTVNDAADVGQADAGAFKIFLVAVQALEDAEQLVDVLHVKAHAIVPDEEDEITIATILAADVDFIRFAGTGILDGIADQD